VVAADGQYVHPVTVDEFRIAIAEVFDVIVEPSGQDAFTIFAQDMGRTGYVSGTLAIREGLRAPIPSVDPRPILTMADMGMGGMDHGGMSGVDMGGSKRQHDMASMPGMDMSEMDMSAMQHGDHGQQPMPGMDMGSSGMVKHPASETGNPLVDMQTMSPVAKLDDPGIGLRDNGRTVLTYGMLKSAFNDPDGRDPGREVEMHLTGNMEKYAWGFNGIKFSQADPVRMNYGERLRIVLVNDTMMTHPIHLHGMWSDLEDEQGSFHLRKHTIDIPPGGRRAYRVRADALGNWAYHCHMLYHMEAGMMRQVKVEE
jgi:CopA family copper-resistance protein